MSNNYEEDYDEDNCDITASSYNNMCDELYDKLYEICKCKDVDGFNSIVNNAAVTVVNDILSKCFEEACWSGDCNVVEFLIDKVVDINRVIFDGCSYLHIVCSFKNADINYYNIAKLLLDNGININSVDHYGDTCLHCACQYNSPNSISVIKLLIENNIDVNAKDECGLTALHHVCIYGYIDIVVLLTDNGANIMDKCYGGDTFREYTLRYRRYDVYKYLEKQIYKRLYVLSLVVQKDVFKRYVAKNVF